MWKLRNQFTVVGHIHHKRGYVSYQNQWGNAIGEFQQNWCIRGMYHLVLFNDYRIIAVLANFEEKGREEMYKEKKKKASL